MSVKLGIVMDPIQSITVKKDSSLAMLLAAQARGWSIEYMELGDLYVRDGVAHGHCRSLTVRDDTDDWFSFGGASSHPLYDLDVILMRKDPPFDMEFVYATYVLERAEQAGVLVINKPRGIRDANEKFFTTWFPHCCPATLVSRRADDIRRFVAEHGDVVIKPLDGMGGRSIFRMRHQGDNVNVIIETLTDNQTRFAMVQKYLPEITAGDKRVLLVDGEPIPYALARIPPADDMRGNLAAGARGEGIELGDQERWIASQVGPSLRERGLIFVGLDVIGDKLTEINVTSPTCIREIHAIFGFDVADLLMETIYNHLNPN